MKMETEYGRDRPVVLRVQQMMPVPIFCLLLLSMLAIVDGQAKVRIAIMDDMTYSEHPIPLKIPNIISCNRDELQVELRWMNTSASVMSLVDQLQSDQNPSDIYLTRTSKLTTELIQDFCQLSRRPFVNMQPSINEANRCLTATMPDILRALVNYLKNEHVHRAIYIYDRNETKHRVYRLLQYINQDDYFNNFALEIRNTQDEEIYSLLYDIESYSFTKGLVPRYIFLDLYSYDDYERMFEKLSHMGLTSDSYYYVVLSTYDVCVWMDRISFSGRLIYFDYQQRDCSRPSSLAPKPVATPSSVTSNYFQTHLFYHRPGLSFRTDSDQLKPSNPTRSMPNNLSSLFLNQESPRCSKMKNRNVEYISVRHLNSHLSNSSHLYSGALVNSLNFLFRLFTTDLIDCTAIRLKAAQKNSAPCPVADVNVFSMKKLSLNQWKYPIELIGRFSTTKNEYRSCREPRWQDASIKQQGAPPRIYYITSLFDEPFLMLRKRTNLQTKYQPSPTNLEELRGHTFAFHELEGYCVELAEKICSHLNITCQFRIVQDGNFGSKNESTGLWNGMVGDIVSRKADMAVAPLTISQKRMEVVDFSKPFMNLGISIMIRKPDAQKPGVFSFMNPVSMEIWLCFSLAYVAVSVILFLTSRIINSGWRRRIVRRPSYRSFSYPKSVNDRRKSEIQLQRQRRDSSFSEQAIPLPSLTRASTRRRSHHRSRPPATQASDARAGKRKDREKDDAPNKDALHLFGISNALFFSFASFMRQSINLVPKSLSGRVAATSWWYFSLIFVSSYTANLVAFLTVEKLVTPIESVEDLAKQQEIKYGSVRNGTTSAFFEKSNVTVFQHMWVVMQRSSSEVFVASNDEGVRKVRHSKGKYAFFIESTKNEYVNERLPCDTMKVGSDLDSKGYGIATRLGSDLTEAINIIVSNLRESGFLDKLKQRWWFDRSECSQTSKDKRFSELSLSSVTGLFYIFLFGIILSCLIAFMEFLITAQAESKKLNLTFREILRIKMIENMIGITIHTQRQLEFGRIDSECNFQYQVENEKPVEELVQRPAYKSQSDV